MAELADALDSKSSGRKVVGVRFPPLVLTTVVTLTSFSRFFVPASGRINSFASVPVNIKTDPNQT